MTATAEGEVGVIEVTDLVKTFRAPFTQRRVEAVRGLSLSVQPGEVFGFLGPNGAGKTTTIRILMGLISPTSGSASIFGEPVPSRAARARLGFLPESPYFYSYLTVAEMLDLTGRLCGMSKRDRARKSGELIERVSLGHARKMPMVKYSKGMLQRAGIAQALIHDPEMVVLDEPMTGLDPIGRADVLEILAELRARGVTVFFSSHILADVEQVCDRAAIIDRGELRALGSIGELIGPASGTDVALAAPRAADLAPLRALCEDIASSGAAPEGDGDGDGDGAGDGEPGDLVRIDARLGAAGDIDAFLVAAHALGARVRSVAPRRLTLEQLFVRKVSRRGGAGDRARPPATATEPEPEPEPEGDAA